MPILAHYEVDRNGQTVVVLLTETGAMKLGARPVDTETKMRTPANKMRTTPNKAR